MSRLGRVGGGKYAWTLQTYLRLRESGLPCVVTDRFPSSGIVISHRDFLPVFLRPRSGVFLICIKPDRKEHTWAHYYIVQNGRDFILRSQKWSSRATVLPVWPQPSLIPRRADRGDLCQNVAYVGRRLNLAQELKSAQWKEQLAAHDFSWSIPGVEAWHDYSHIDVTVSVRSFSPAADASPFVSADSKPASKLVNSWLAGVPAIVGRESAYESARESDLDYIEVGSSKEITNALLELRRDPRLYRRMVDHGRLRARDFSTDALCRRWHAALSHEISPAYEEWRRRGRMKRAYANVRGMVEYFANLEHWRDFRTLARAQDRVMTRNSS